MLFMSSCELNQGKANQQIKLNANDNKTVRFPKEVKEVNDVYGAGPRDRFDSLLDGRCQQVMNCNDEDGGVRNICNAWCPPGDKKYSNECKYVSDDSDVYNDCICDFGETCLETQFVEIISKITGVINALSVTSGPLIIPAELALAFLMEGGHYGLLQNYDRFDSYGDIGVDNLLSENCAIKSSYLPYMSDVVKKYVESSSCEKLKNEDGDTVYETRFTLEPALHANAGMYAYFRQAAIKAFAARNIDFGSFSKELQFFWSYVFFNIGETRAIPMLNSRVDADTYKDTSWGGNDDSYRRNKFSANHNATVRAANLAYLRLLCQRHPDYVAPLFCQGL